jgi:synaptic vesicle membrane protein VAT-1
MQYSAVYSPLSTASGIILIRANQYSNPLMRQVWITKRGDPGVLELREAPDPIARAGEVLIRVEAAGINYADLMARQGLYPDAPKLPAVPGLEVAGVVEMVGADVRNVTIGDDVLALTLFGGYSSHVTVPEKQVFRRPEGMTAETGAALPVNYLTAFQAMVVMGGIRHAHELGGNRMRVLIHGAGGGVGTAAGDLGQIYGAELFGTSSPHKLDYVRGRGYEHAISYRGNDWRAEARELTGGRGFDLILDPTGGSSWSASLDVLAPTGRLIVYGYAAALGRTKLSLVREAGRIPWSRFLPFHLMSANRGVIGVNIGRLWQIQDEVAAWARKLLSYYERREIRPHVDRTFLLEEAAAAHAYIEARKNLGKVVLVP